jgi:hypothetical protein
MAEEDVVFVSPARNIQGTGYETCKVFRSKINDRNYTWQGAAIRAGGNCPNSYVTGKLLPGNRISVGGIICGVGVNAISPRCQ